MRNKILITPIDNLVEIVSEAGTIPISKLCAKLQISKDILIKWIVVLEEFHILRLFYKGFDGFVEFKKKGIDTSLEQKKEELNIDKLKQEFLKKIEFRNISKENLKILWERFVSINEKEIKKVFYEKSKKRGFQEKLIDFAWTKYLEEIKKI